MQFYPIPNHILGSPDVTRGYGGLWLWRPDPLRGRLKPIIKFREMTVREVCRIENKITQKCG